MAAKSIHIIASQQTRRALASLGTPIVDVAVRGRVVEEGGTNCLVIEGVSTQRSSSLPILASPSTRQSFGELSRNKQPVSVTVKGRIVQQRGSSVLLLDRVASTKNLAIMASDNTRKVLAELASAGDSGEVSVKAKVVNDNGNKVLVLESGNSGGKSKRK